MAAPRFSGAPYCWDDTLDSGISAPEFKGLSEVRRDDFTSLSVDHQLIEAGSNSSGINPQIIHLKQ